MTNTGHAGLSWARRLEDTDHVLLDLLADEGLEAGKRAEIVFVFAVLCTGGGHLGKRPPPVGPTITYSGIYSGIYSGSTNFSLYSEPSAQLAFGACAGLSRKAAAMSPEQPR